MTKRFCSNCGVEFDGNSKFCSKCGAILVDDLVTPVRHTKTDVAIENKYAAVVCSRCGGNEFKTDLNSGAALCLHCNTTFVPLSENENSSEKKLENGELFLHKFRNLEKANDYFLEASRLNPHNFRCWWGLAKVISDNFTNYQISTGQLETLQGYVDKAVLTASSDIKPEIKSIYDKYVAKVTEIISDKQKKLSQELGAYNCRIADTKTSIKCLKDKQQELSKKIDTYYVRLNYSNYRLNIKSYIVPMIISAIIALILGAILYNFPNWDASTWIVGGPALLAALVFVVCFLIVLIKYIVFIVNSSKGAAAERNYKKYSNEKSMLQTEMNSLNSQLRGLESKAEEINNQLKLL